MIIIVEGQIEEKMKKFSKLEIPYILVITKYQQINLEELKLFNDEKLKQLENYYIFTTYKEEELGEIIKSLPSYGVNEDILVLNQNISEFYLPYTKRANIVFTPDNTTRYLCGSIFIKKDEIGKANIHDIERNKKSLFDFLSGYTFDSSSIYKEGITVKSLVEGYKKEIIKNISSGDQINKNTLLQHTSQNIHILRYLSKYFMNISSQKDGKPSDNPIKAILTNRPITTPPIYILIPHNRHDIEDSYRKRMTREGIYTYTIINPPTNEVIKYLSYDSTPKYEITHMVMAMRFFMKTNNDVCIIITDDRLLRKDAFRYILAVTAIFLETGFDAIALGTYGQSLQEIQDFQDDEEDTARVVEVNGGCPECGHMITKNGSRKYLFEYDRLYSNVKGNGKIETNGNIINPPLFIPNTDMVRIGHRGFHEMYT